MTTLQSTSPPLLEATAFAASTLLLAATALSPKPVWALGFFWVIEMAACMPDYDSQKPRTAYKKCKIGYAFHRRFKQCLRKKYHGNWELEQERHKLANQPTKSTTWRPNTGGDTINVDQGDNYGGAPSSGTLLGYGDNLGTSP